MNSGTSSLTADSCAGCHRAHTAQGEYLLKAASEQALCISCHGSTGTLATVNVEDGVQYVPVSASDQSRSGTVLGALRDGGFRNARIGASAPTRLMYIRGWDDSPVNTVPAISTRPKVSAGSSETINSAHVKLDNTVTGVTTQGVMWGKALSGLGEPVTDLGCVDCHNPHGNNTYRILRPVPGADTPPLGAPTSIPVKATYANADTIVTSTQHGLAAGDTVQFTGVTASGLSDNTNYVVISVVNGFTIKVATGLASSGATTAFDITTDTTPTAGTAFVTRTSVAVADVPVDPDGDGSNPTKNYTIIQTKGSQGVNGTYLLYARDVTAALGGGGVAQDQSAVTIVSNTTSYIVTSGAHGLAAGDRVQITGMGAAGLSDGIYTVAGTSIQGSYYLDRFTLAGYGTSTYVVGGNQTPLTAISPGGYGGTPTVQRLAISGDYSSTGGDYFHRTVPWNPAINNPSCDPTVSTGSETNASTKNAAYCAAANDAPNGRPASILQVGSGSGAVLGQQAFNDQISTWCAQCHTRYYSNTNENPDGGALTTLANTPIASFNGGGFNIAAYAPTGVKYGGPSYGDTIQFQGLPGAVTNLSNNTDYYVIATGSGTFQVAVSMTGGAITPNASIGTSVTFTRTYQSSNSSWGYPRDQVDPNDPFKYQHQTTTNRACTTCHVAHGSNANVQGQNGTQLALNVPYPDGTTTSSSSRLLKVDNRGTCQMCHDPTGTTTAGQTMGDLSKLTVVP